MSRTEFLKSKNILNKAIFIGGSAGSFKVVNKILTDLPANYPFPVVICMHRLRNIRSGFVSTLAINCQLKIKEAIDKEKISPSTVFIAPANYHLMINHGFHFSLSIEPPINHSRPSIDIMMETAAEVYREKAVGILLSGANTDGAKGMEKINENEGITIVQDPKKSDIPTMPESCLRLFEPTKVADVDSIIKFILELSHKN